jgi:hypothetical protein
MSKMWTPAAVALACPYCGASVGARCRTYLGAVCSAPHRGRLVDYLVCPRCGTTDTDPINVLHGYCSACHDWTAPGSRRVHAGQDTLL